MRDDRGRPGGDPLGRRLLRPSLHADEVEIPRPPLTRRLRKAQVEPDSAERRRLIVEGLARPVSGEDPTGVLEEVVYLVEWPLVLEGTFDERFLQLPERVIVTAMESHQRYFPLGGDRFAFVANGGDPDIVRRGNERVLEGRLEDASFTFERDVAGGSRPWRSSSTRSRSPRGPARSPTRPSGSVSSREVLGGGEASGEAARLAKADQASTMVREFPDLEGHIGAEYARLAGFPEAVCCSHRRALPPGRGRRAAAADGSRARALRGRQDRQPHRRVRARRTPDGLTRPVRPAPRCDRPLPPRGRGRARDRSSGWSPATSSS